jgi:hypothetical protein
LIEISGLGTANLLKDFKEVGKEGPFQVSGCKCYIRRATYLFEHVNLKEPVRTNLMVAIVEHNGFYYFINMHDSSEAGENAQKEFDSLIRTIKLV